MKRFIICVVLVFLGFLPHGCSQKTQRETREAIKETGEAVESAAKDAVKVTKGAVEGAKKALQQDDAEADAEVEESP